MEQADLIWQNGELVAWEDAKVHVLTHGLHYGTGVFEGVRAYDTAQGSGIFRHQDHIDRLFASAKLFYMDLPHSKEEIRQATHELLKANGLRECYIRPVAYRGYGSMGLNPLAAPVEMAIACWPWGAYLGAESKLKGIRAKVASWRRMSSDSFIPQAKANGQYLNSILAKIESVKAGYDETIMLDDHGYVSEGSGENIFVVLKGKLVTPPPASGILNGITRAAIIEIATDQGIEIIERNIARAELYLADEVFLTGTAAELVPVTEIDDHKVADGVRGPVTAQLAETFEDALHGREDRYLHWLDIVDVPARVATPT